MLEINNIEVVYNNIILVLKGISLKVDDGGIVALLGSNGAGKTTTLKSISGLLSTELGKVTHGNIEFNGQKIEKREPEDIVKLGIVQVLEGRRQFEHLNVEENIMTGVFARTGNTSIRKDLDLIYGYFPKLRDLRKAISGYCSGGEQQMQVIGRALMAHPKLMLLDEPSLGLAPMLVDEIFGIVQKINVNEKTAILLVEQNAVAALNIAQYGYVMENGKIVLDGSADKLKDNEDIREFYLGLGQLGQRKSYKEVKHYKRRKRWLG